MINKVCTAMVHARNNFMLNCLQIMSLKQFIADYSSTISLKQFIADYSSTIKTNKQHMKESANQHFCIIIILNVGFGTTH